MSGLVGLRFTTKDPTLAEIALAAAEETNAESAIKDESVKLAQEKAEEQKSALDSLKAQDKEINDVVAAISGLQGEARENAIKAIGTQMGNMLVDRLSTMLLDEDVRGRYLSSKKGEISLYIERIDGINAGSAGKEMLNGLVRIAVMKGFLEGASRTMGGDPDISTLRSPKVNNKVVGGLLRNLRIAAEHCESNCIFSAQKHVKSINNPRDLEKVVRQLAAEGWIVTPLPKNENDRIQLHELQAPELENRRLYQDLKDLVKEIKLKPGEFGRLKRNKKKS